MSYVFNYEKTNGQSGVITSKFEDKQLSKIMKYLTLLKTTKVIKNFSVSVQASV